MEVSHSSPWATREFQASGNIILPHLTQTSKPKILSIANQALHDPVSHRGLTPSPAIVRLVHSVLATLPLCEQTGEVSTPGPLYVLFFLPGTLFPHVATGLNPSYHFRFHSIRELFSDHSA